jgi:hypothetical protein
VTAEECFAKACHDPEIFIPQHKAIKWARSHYVLNGAGLWEVLELMMAEGIPHDDKVYRDGLFFSVDWTDDAMLRNAVSKGPVKLGVAADHLINSVWQTQPSNGWIATGLPAGDPQDHCISLCGYGPLGWLASQLGTVLPPSMAQDATNSNAVGYAIFTWSSIGIIDKPSLLAITGEAWLRLPTTIIE